MPDNQNKFANREVALVFRFFPDAIREKLLFLRELILESAASSPEVGKLSESLKWGEPSYSCASGSPVRLGWNEKEPDRYSMFFHCQTKLVATFRSLYPDTLRFEGNRAIRFQTSDIVPEKAIRQCCLLALTYHKVKHLPLLGAGPGNSEVP